MATSSPRQAPLDALAGVPKRPARLAQPVVEALTDSIVSGALPRDSVLPPEAALVDAFGVSRITIREAIKLLEAKGLVEARQGSGTIVRGEDDWNLLDPVILAAAVRHDDQRGMLDELVAVRESLESMLARQAAVNATDEDLADIAAILDELREQETTPERFTETDVRFHERIMSAAGNRLARAIVRTVHAEARTSYRYSGQPRAEDCRITNREHRVIVDKLLARDADGAARAMSDHILRAWERRRPRPTGRKR